MELFSIRIQRTFQLVSTPELTEFSSQYAFLPRLALRSVCPVVPHILPLQFLRFYCPPSGVSSPFYLILNVASPAHFCPRRLVFQCKGGLSRWIPSL